MEALSQYGLYLYQPTRELDEGAYNLVIDSVNREQNYVSNYTNYFEIAKDLSEFMKLERTICRMNREGQQSVMNVCSAEGNVVGIAGFVRVNRLSYPQEAAICLLLPIQFFQAIPSLVLAISNIAAGKNYNVSLLYTGLPKLGTAYAFECAMDSAGFQVDTDFYYLPLWNGHEFIRASEEYGLPPTRDFPFSEVERGNDEEDKLKGELLPAKIKSQLKERRELQMRTKFEPVPCTYWARGACRYGASCRNIHDPSLVVVARPRGGDRDRASTATVKKRQPSLRYRPPIVEPYEVEEAERGGFMAAHGTVKNGRDHGQEISAEFEGHWGLLPQHTPSIYKATATARHPFPSPSIVSVTASSLANYQGIFLSMLNIAGPEWLMMLRYRRAGPAAAFAERQSMRHEDSRLLAVQFESDSEVQAVDEYRRTVRQFTYEMVELICVKRISFYFTTITDLLSLGWTDVVVDSSLIYNNLDVLLSFASKQQFDMAQLQQQQSQADAWLASTQQRQDGFEYVQESPLPQRPSPTRIQQYVASSDLIFPMTYPSYMTYVTRVPTVMSSLTPIHSSDIEKNAEIVELSQATRRSGVYPSSPSPAEEVGYTFIDQDYEQRLSPEELQILQIGNKKEDMRLPDAACPSPSDVEGIDSEHHSSKKSPLTSQHTDTDAVAKGEEDAVAVREKDAVAVREEDAVAVREEDTVAVQEEDTVAMEGNDAVAVKGTQAVAVGVAGKGESGGNKGRKDKRRSRGQNLGP